MKKLLFLLKIENLPKNDRGCKEWDMYCNPIDGYGRVSFMSKSWAVHRLIWTLLKGNIPKETPLVLHYCDNKKCCEITHLHLGTNADNTHEMLERNEKYNNLLSTTTAWLNDLNNKNIKSFTIKDLIKLNIYDSVSFHNALEKRYLTKSYILDMSKIERLLPIKSKNTSA